MLAFGSTKYLQKTLKNTISNHISTPIFPLPFALMLFVLVPAEFFVQKRSLSKTKIKYFKIFYLLP